MSLLAPSTPNPPDGTGGIAVVCKCCIAELEQELEDACGVRDTRSKGPHATPLRLGRCIRRLVTLRDRVEDLVNEADRRACLDEDESETHDFSEEEDRLYSAYKELLRWKPSLRKMFESETDLQHLAEIYKELNKGADSARADDAASLKPEVIHWLMSLTPSPEPALRHCEKDGRGFHHDVTGRLLCPVDYEWGDLEQRAAIRDFHPDFLVTADSWPAFLYENKTYNANNPTHGFLQNRLLVKAFKHIFTSPTSAAKMDEKDEQKPQKRSRREGHWTRSHVVALLGMRSVSPRAIAYIAVQVYFHSIFHDSWCLLDSEFNYHEFYYNIISYFENAETPDKEKKISDLLLWWNCSSRMIFGRTNMSVYRPQDAQKMSVAKLLPKRARH